MKWVGNSQIVDEMAESRIFFKMEIENWKNRIWKQLARVIIDFKSDSGQKFIYGKKHNTICT